MFEHKKSHTAIHENIDNIIKKWDRLLSQANFKDQANRIKLMILIDDNHKKIHEFKSVLIRQLNVRCDVLNVCMCFWTFFENYKSNKKKGLQEEMNTFAAQYDSVKCFMNKFNNLKSIHSDELKLSLDLLSDLNDGIKVGFQWNFLFVTQCKQFVWFFLPDSLLFFLVGHFSQLFATKMIAFYNAQNNMNNLISEVDNEITQLICNQALPNEESITLQLYKSFRFFVSKHTQQNCVTCECMFTEK